MLYLQKKSLKIRKEFSKNEIKLKSKKFVFINLLNNKVLDKKKLIYSFLKNNKKYKSNLKLKSRIKNRCLISNSARSVSSKFKLSRRYFKNALSFGIIPGYKKAVW